MSHVSVLFLTLALLLWAPAVSAQAYVPIPDEFAAAIVMQASTGKILYSFKPEIPRVAASLTKLATGLAIIGQKPNWNRVVRLASQDEVGGGRLRVATGASLTMRDLFYSALTGSANNASSALGRLSGLGMKNFVAKMNSSAKSVGAKRTVLNDPSGMDPRNMTTALDMALIARAAFKDPLIRSASTVSTYDFRIQSTGELKSIKNTNKLFLEDQSLWLIGGKTGYLEESMYNLVAQIRPYDGKISDPKREVVVVVLGAPTKDSSFASVKRLAQWAWEQPEIFRRPVIEPISRDLDYGVRGPAVVVLQTWLAQDPALYPEGIISGFFGPATRAAVRRFQLREGVVSSPKDRGYGRVGPATRAKLGELMETE